MRKVFLDLGAHAAISVKKFREEYPNSDEYEIISFECNPRFTEVLQNTDGITFHNKAAWIEDGTQDFYLGHAASSSLIYGKTRGNLDFDNPITVESIDISKWVVDIVYAEFHGKKVHKEREDTKKIRTAIRERGIPVHHWDAQSKKPIVGL
jgi:hypothetical protein